MSAQIGPLAVDKKLVGEALGKEPLGSTCTFGPACHDGQPRYLDAFKGV